MSEKQKTEEEIAAEAKAEEEQTPSEEELKNEIETLKQDKASLTSEIKEVRQEKGALKEDVEALKEAVANTPPITPDPDEKIDVKATVESILAGRESSRAKSNKKTAIEKFVGENKEFLPDNDPTGLKRDALEKAMNRLNLSDAIEVEDFTKLIKDAERLLGRTDTTTETAEEKEIKNPYASSSSSKSTPTVVVDKDLLPEEKDVIEAHGFSKEKFLRLKERYPEYIQSLLKQ